MGKAKAKSTKTKALAKSKPQKIKKTDIKTLSKKEEPKEINVPKCPRFDYSKNHQAIENYLVSHLKQHYTLPTEEQIAKALKISRKTVIRHLQEICLENFMPQYKNLSPKVMLGLFSRALKGHPLAVKLWMQLVEGWSEKIIRENQNPGMEQVLVDYLKMSEAELEQEHERRWAEEKN